jgi:NTP pyrophosphatase (non-canonical NTP hydrolase)
MRSDSNQAATIDELQQRVFRTAADKGFHSADITYDRAQILQALCLVHTEVSEAAQEVKRHFDGGEPDPERHNKFGEELADAVIRLFDVAEMTGVSLENQVLLKMRLNEARPHMYGTPWEESR